MNYIVFDLEWNQSFNRKTIVKTPVYLFGEIIQIGAVKMDEDYHILDTFHIIVSPKYYTKMHKSVSKLTKITAETLQYGFSFPIAFRHFQKWCGEEFILFTWGRDDIGVLRSNMILHRMNTDWLPPICYDIQMIFDDQIAKEHRQISLTNAMEIIQKPIYEAHNVLNDAKNTAVIFRCLDMKKGMEEYEKFEKEQKLSGKDAIETGGFIQTNYTRESMCSNPQFTNFYSTFFECQVRCDAVVCQCTNKYISIGKMENGESVFVRFNIKKKTDGTAYVSRLLYPMNEQKTQFYFHKRQRTKERSLIDNTKWIVNG